MYFVSQLYPSFSWCDGHDAIGISASSNVSKPRLQRCRGLRKRDQNNRKRGKDPAHAVYLPSNP